MIKFRQNKQGNAWPWLALGLVFSGCVVLAFVGGQFASAVSNDASAHSQSSIVPRDIA